MLTSKVRGDIDEFITQEPWLKVVDVAEKMIDVGLVTGRITNFISNLWEHANMRKLFVLFVIKRNFILINFLFQKMESWEFSFDYTLFLACLYNDAYDIAVMMHKDFSSSLSSLKVRKAIVPYLISAFGKNSGLIEAKGYLLKRYFDAFTLVDAQCLLEQLDYRVSNFSKSHIFVVNTNPIKVSCILIEILKMIQDEYYCLNKRCQW